MLYKGDKGIYDASRPPEVGPAEAGGLLASSLPWDIGRLARMSDSLLKSLSLQEAVVRFLYRSIDIEFIGTSI